MKNDGGPAFPRPSKYESYDSGMSLLQFYAGLAMQTILDSIFKAGGFTFKVDAKKGKVIGFQMDVSDEVLDEITRVTAEISRKQARAMIEELEKDE